MHTDSCPLGRVEEDTERSSGQPLECAGRRMSGRQEEDVVVYWAARGAYGSCRLPGGDPLVYWYGSLARKVSIRTGHIVNVVDRSVVYTCCLLILTEDHHAYHVGLRRSHDGTNQSDCGTGSPSSTGYHDHVHGCRYCCYRGQGYHHGCQSH